MHTGFFLLRFHSYQIEPRQGTVFPKSMVIPLVSGYAMFGSSSYVVGRPVESLCGHGTKRCRARVLSDAARLGN
ncbi:hypothetical protein SAMN04487769_2236 [Burkholderia sp. b14]|nr:hypothetical protein SAMN04487769_2236 [Burkholderia sp. b14]